MVAVDSVAPSPENPRTSAGDVSELAASIQAVGIIEPLIVRSTGEDTYVLIAGERRLTAAKSVGLAEVPAIVRDLDDAKAYELSLIDNLHRQDLSALDEAQAYRRLIKEFGYTPAR
jgi:ParB family chromosome partitioning protein